MNRDLIESYKQEICEIRRLSRSRVRLRQGGQKAARGVSKAIDWAADNPYKAGAIATGIAAFISVGGASTTTFTAGGLSTITISAILVCHLWGYG